MSTNVTRQKDLGIHRPGESSGKFAATGHDEAAPLSSTQPIDPLHISLSEESARKFWVDSRGGAVDLDNGVPFDIYKLFETVTERVYDLESNQDELDILAIARQFEKTTTQLRGEDEAVAQLAAAQTHAEAAQFGRNQATADTLQVLTQSQHPDATALEIIWNPDTGRAVVAGYRSTAGGVHEISVNSQFQDVLRHIETNRDMEQVAQWDEHVSEETAFHLGYLLTFDGTTTDARIRTLARTIENESVPETVMAANARSILGLTALQHFPSAKKVELVDINSGPGSPYFVVDRVVSGHGAELWADDESIDASTFRETHFDVFSPVLDRHVSALTKLSDEKYSFTIV